MLGKWAESGLLSKLTLGRTQKVFAVVDLTFRNGPRPFVFVSEKWTARMRHQELDVPFPVSEHEEARTDLSRHRFLLYVTNRLLTYPQFANLGHFRGIKGRFNEPSFHGVRYILG